MEPFHLFSCWCCLRRGGCCALNFFQRFPAASVDNWHNHKRERIAPEARVPMRQLPQGSPDSKRSLAALLRNPSKIPATFIGRITVVVCPAFASPIVDPLRFARLLVHQNLLLDAGLVELVRVSVSLVPLLGFHRAQVYFHPDMSRTSISVSLDGLIATCYPTAQ